MTTLTASSPPPFLSRKLVWAITPAHLLVLAIMLLSVVIHITNLEAIGDANTYYTAAAESMTQSWHNFFFAAAEPGGSVSIDKPPLGLWIEAAFAFVFGVEGWVVSLPNILAGIFSVPVLYLLVKKYMGDIAGLAAALVLVVTPVAIATNRNNTMDGMLVFTLLLAAWAFVQATETGKARWLFLGAFIMGLGFNIKMLQAFLPLPAFYALYFLGARTTWWKKIIAASISGIILLVVSLSWAVIVDLTPADQRPYIGSSENNTVMELIIGHNGWSRLFGRDGANARSDGQNAGSPIGSQPLQLPDGTPSDGNLRPQQQAPPQALAACENLSVGEACSFTLVDGNTIHGTCILPPNTDELACSPQAPLPQNGMQTPQPGNRIQPPAGALGDGPNVSPNGPGNATTPISQETGSPGIARFFVAPLSKQMSWLLPFALISLVLMVLAARLRLPLEPAHKAFVLWGGWLLTCLVFFSAVEGIFHAYYTIMLAPALGAVIGGGISQIWQWQAHHRWANALLMVAAAITIAFQIYTANHYGAPSAWIYLSVILWLIAGGLIFFRRCTGTMTVLASLLVIPLVWTIMTILDATPDVNLPTAYDGMRQGASQPTPERNVTDRAEADFLAWLQANTQVNKYLIAVPSSHEGSSLVLATGRPVLYMGGFNGADPVIDAEGLAELVARGDLRYVLFGGGNGKQEIAQWLRTSCTVVPEFSRTSPYPDGLNYQQQVLYQCNP